MTRLAEEITILTELYLQGVLSRRTRSISLFGRKCQPKIEETFLGFELKFGKRRITCPDQVTARYAKIFAELGMPTIQVPYDPSLTRRLLPKLEKSMEAIRVATSTSAGGGLPSRIPTYKKIRTALKQSTARPADRE